MFTQLKKKKKKRKKKKKIKKKIKKNEKIGQIKKEKDLPSPYI